MLIYSTETTGRLVLCWLTCYSLSHLFNTVLAKIRHSCLYTLFSWVNSVRIQTNNGNKWTNQWNKILELYNFANPWWDTLHVSDSSISLEVSKWRTSDSWQYTLMKVSWHFHQDVVISWGNDAKLVDILQVIAVTLGISNLNTKMSRPVFYLYWNLEKKTSNLKCII